MTLESTLDENGGGGQCTKSNGITLSIMGPALSHAYVSNQNAICASYIVCDCLFFYLMTNFLSRH